VRLVVDDHDRAVLAQVVTDAVDHLVGRFRERAGGVRGQHPPGQAARGALLAEPEGVEVGDDDPRRPQVSSVLHGNDGEGLVVVVGVGRQQHAQPVADGHAGGDDEEGVGEPLVVRVAALVEYLPGDAPGHPDRLAAAGRHLAGAAEQLGPRLVRLLPQVLLDPVVAVPGLLRDLRDEDERCERLELTEAPRAEAVLGVPVCAQGAGDAGDVRPTQVAPGLPQLPDAIAVPPRGLRLLQGVEQARSAPLLRRGEGEKVTAVPPAGVGGAGDLVVGVEPEVPGRRAVGRVPNRVVAGGAWRQRRTLAG
jgi:hypothetical protein